MGDPCGTILLRTQETRIGEEWKMNSYKNQEFEGERALFKTNGATIEGCRFHDGESPLKESNNLDISKSSFEWKYPLWYCHNVKVNDSDFATMARAGIWYTKEIEAINCRLIAPKLFRRCFDLSISDCNFEDAQETLWWNESVKLNNITAKNGNYFSMQSKNIEANNLDLQGNYAFDGCENVVVRNSKLHTKDAFWNCKNVLVEDSFIEGEYFGWNSENVTLRNCEIHSHQGFCYMKNITLINCKLIDTDLAFEYCEDIDAEINSDIVSIKNPISGRIVCHKVEELIFDDPNIDPSKTEIAHAE